MINTIFRFVPNEATYNNEKSQISARTIVFCEQEGSIYKNGVKYAGSKDGIDGLPGVDGIDGGGTTKERIEKLIGDAVKVTPNAALTGTTIATIKVNNNTYTLKAPASTNDEGGGNTEYETVEVQANEDNHGIEIGRIKVGSNPWVVFRSPFSSDGEDPENPQPVEPTIPQEVIDKINELDGDIDQLKSDLQDLHDQNEQGINDTVQEALDEWAAFKGANGLVGTNGEWEWTKDADGNPLFFSTLGWKDSTTGTWSSIKQRINSLELSVKGIVDNGNGLYDISEALIKQWVELNVDGTYIANALMNASYANADDDGNVLKWLVSGFKASAASGKTVAQMFSDSSEGAIAGVMTEVNKKADSDEVENVKASIAAMWGDGAIAGANAVADPSKVRASLFATNADKTASAKIIVDAINDSTDSSIILDASKINITANFINAVKAELDVDSIVTNKLTAGTGKFIGNVEATSFKVMNGNVESIVFTTMTSSLRSQYNNLDASGIEDGEPIGIVYSNGAPKYFFDFAPLTNTGVTTHGPMYFYTLKNTTGAAGTEVNSTRGFYYDSDYNFYTSPEGWSTQKVSSTDSAYYQNLYIDYGYYTNTDYYAFVRSIEDNCWFIVSVTLYKPVSFSNGVMTISNSETYIVSSNTKSMSTAGITYSTTCGYLQTLGNGQVYVEPSEVRDYDDDGITSRVYIYGTYLTSTKTAYDGSISLETFDGDDYSSWNNYTY